jgi:hypothetical protein
MTLRAIFREMYATAAARQAGDQPGESYRVLAGGAEVRVRVLGKKHQVVLSRRRVFVSEEEIRTFRRDGGIPEGATRKDYKTPRDKRRHVALTWEAQATLFDLLDKATEAPAPQQDAEEGRAEVS